MRSLILGLGISLDGYIARKDGSFDFLIMPKDFWKESMAPFFQTIDTAIMGRKTWDITRQGGEGFMSGIRSYVLSRSLQAGEQQNAIITRQTPRALVTAIRRKRGKDIWIMGGGEMAREFLKADLVDELYLGLVPVLLGEGIPLFPAGFPQRNFKLMENRTFSQGLVSLRYKRKR